MNLQHGFIVGTLYVALAAGLGGAVAGAYGTRLYYLHQIELTASKERAAADIAAESNRMAAKAYENLKPKRAKKAAITTRKVDDAIKANPVWRDEPLPDSVRQSFEAAAVDLGATEPGGGVPGVPGPAADDQR